MDNLGRQARKSTVKQQKQQNVTLTEYLLCSSFCGKSLTYFLSFTLTSLKNYIMNPILQMKQLSDAASHVLNYK